MFGWTLIRKKKLRQLNEELCKANMQAGILTLELEEMSLTYIQPRDKKTGRFVKRDRD